MKGIGTFFWLTQAAATLRNIGMRTWIAIGVVVVLLLGLLVWAAIALVSWLWVQGVALSDAGMRVLSDAVTQVEQLKPGLLAEAERGLQGAREQVGQWAPGIAEALPTIDVSGTDIGPVARFPGLIRSSYAAEGGATEVAYAGLAAMATVVTHYVSGFTDAGFAHEVLSATATGERHRFTRGDESFNLTVTPGMAGLIEVRLRQAAAALPGPVPEGSEEPVPPAPPQPT